MADIPLGSVEKIVKIALKIKDAVETVKQNEKECGEIQRCVARVTALLKRLDETTETMRDEVMRDVLEDLAESLELALKLVTECQQKHIIRRFLGAGDMAKELGRVQDDIVRKLLLGNFATNVQTTIMVTNIQSAGVPPPPPPPGPKRVHIDGFIQFSFSELKDATEDFSDKNIIGQGGSATVYQILCIIGLQKSDLGILHDGQVVAIKKFSQTFLNDNQDSLYDAINIFIELKHKNVARPLGYSHEIIMVLVSYNDKYVGAEDQRFCFIEEYMPAGSMEHAIIKGSGLVDWSSRFKMVQGIAQGLHYLHEQRVIHLDMKPSNILLDSDMNPRISDLGVAKRLDHGDDEITHDNDYLVGTPAYMAPEYLSKGTVSTKCDVYAFGLTLLWTINGISISTQPGIIESIRWAWKAREAVQMELFDPSLCDKSQLMEIKRCMEVGLLCIEHDRKDRPTMGEVLAMLNGEIELPAPKQPVGVEDIRPKEGPAA